MSNIIILDEASTMSTEEAWWLHAKEGVDYEYKQNKTESTWCVLVASRFGLPNEIIFKIVGYLVDKVKYPICDRCGIRKNPFHDFLYKNKQQCEIIRLNTPKKNYFDQLLRFHGLHGLE
jgi:hypothetical protein